MDKTAFIDELHHLLNALPKAERQQHIDYYEEMIDDRMEDGLTEEDAIAALGSAADIATQILAECPPQSPRKFRGWEILLLVLGSPIWLTLLFGALMVILGVILVVVMIYAVLWAALIALYAADLSLLAGVIAGIAGGILYTAKSIAAPALLFFGGSLVCAGCAVLLFFICNKLAVWLARLGKWAVLRFIGLLRRKDGKK